MPTTQAAARVVVLGGGYAGLMSAIRLASRTRHASVTLVNQSDVFVERVRLHQYAANQSIRRRKLEDVLAGTRVQFRHAAVSAIDLTHRAVKLGDADLEYDYLVIAVGSQTDTHEHAYTLNTTGPRSVEALRAQLPGLNERGGHVLVVGGGPTGVESAAEFAESFPGLRVTLATRNEVLPRFPGKPSVYAERQLSRLGVKLLNNTPVAEIDDGIARLANGQSISFDVCLWCGGFQATDLARDSGLVVNNRNQVLVDAYLRSVSHPEVFAVGDAAYPDYDLGMEFRMAAFTAVVSGAHAADVLASLIKQREPRPLSFAYAGLGIALGRHDAIGINTYPYGEANGFPMLTGGPAASIRELFVRLLANCARFERLRPGLFIWVGAPRTKSPRPAPSVVA
jgi:NADH dehydrogenase FAD-containing subunit